MANKRIDHRIRYKDIPNDKIYGVNNEIEVIKEKLLEYGEGAGDIDYKLQIIEMLEDLNYIEIAYNMAKKVQLSLPPESMKIEEVRKLVRRLHTAPIIEQKDLI